MEIRHVIYGILQHALVLQNSVLPSAYASSFTIYVITNL
jgi:hypothetical protein